MSSLSRFLIEPEDYDFVYESGANLPDNPLERYMIYKASKTDAIESVYYQDGNETTVSFINNAWNSYPELNGFDCDNCYLAQYIYRALWGRINKDNKSTCPTFFNKLNSERSDNYFEFSADTMNSVQTIMNEIISQKNDKSFNKIKKSNYYSEKLCIELYNNKTYQKFKEYIEFSNDNKTMPFIDYIGAYHTIGNYCLVPNSFNGKRNNRNISDYWDRSLYILQEYGYEDLKNDQFTRYINYFFLWDYAPSGKVKPYSYEKVSEKNGVYEFTGFNEYDFFSEAVKRIKRRGIFMVAMLRLQQNMGEEIYEEEIRKKVFATDRVYDDGYEDVFKEIKKILSENRFNSSGLCEAQNKINAIT